MKKKRRIGIVGYGKLGQYLSDSLLNDPGVKEEHDLAFVWNRTYSNIGKEIPTEKKLRSLDDFAERNADLIVEVAHPDISHNYAVSFLEHADYLVGSPTAFADTDFEINIIKLAYSESGNGVYIPRGAMPGLDDILRKKYQWSEGNIVMKKHPNSINYKGDVDLDKIKEETTLYDGHLRPLCLLAPNNVNTMAVFALASGLGFDNVQAKLVADPALEHHIIEVTVVDEGGCELKYTRKNPAAPGARTGTATFKSFLDSMVNSFGVGNGIHYR